MNNLDIFIKIIFILYKEIFYKKNEKTTIIY